MNGMTGIGFSKTADKKISGTLPSKKTLLILILICFSVTMSSCVYLRILALRKQFTQFDKYIVVDKKDGLTFSFLRPTLYGNDIKWLGLYPVSQKTKSGVTIWKHILEKMYNDNQAETGSYDFPIDTRYQNENYMPYTFQRVSLPPCQKTSLLPYANIWGNPIWISTKGTEKSGTEEEMLTLTIHCLQ